MDLRSLVRDFIEISKGLTERLRSNERIALSHVDLHLLRVQLHLLEIQSVANLNEKSKNKIADVKKPN